jgi:uncharacterized membrane protein required for colicin V production
MVSLTFFFWMYVLLFAVIGAMRGWAKELLVSFSVILALALNFMLYKFIPIISSMPPAPPAGETPYLFWLRTIILIGLVYFGYQTVVSIERLASRARRERLADTLFGLVMGAFNGYLIAGSLWFYLNDAGYPFPKFITPPQGEMLATVTRMMDWMPPHLLGEPGIYFAVILCFVFVLVVYI